MEPRNLLACVIVAVVALVGKPAWSQISHMGQSIDDHVVLVADFPDDPSQSVCPFGSFTGTEEALLRVFPDGTRGSIPFEVPPGRLLVVTDVEWKVERRFDGANLTRGRTVEMILFIGSGNTFDTFHLVFRSRMVQVGRRRAPVGTSEQLTTGFVVASNTAICPQATERGPGSGAAARVSDLILRGYLLNTAR